MRRASRDALRMAAALVAPDLTHGTITLKVSGGDVRDVRIDEAVTILDGPDAEKTAKPPPAVKA